MTTQHQLNRIEAKLDYLISKESHQMAAIDDRLQTLTDQVSANTTVIGSAKTMIGGFSAQLAAAVAAAQGAGATQTQLQALTDLSAALKSSDDDLADAIVKNTPAA